MLLRCALHLGLTDVLEQLLEKSNIDIESIRAVFCTGEAHALLESDLREKESLQLSGNPTFVLNEARQKLYGNVGYGVIERQHQGSPEVTKRWNRQLVLNPVGAKFSWW